MEASMFFAEYWARLSLFLRRKASENICVMLMSILVGSSALGGREPTVWKYNERENKVRNRSWVQGRKDCKNERALSIAAIISDESHDGTYLASWENQETRMSRRIPVCEGMHHAASPLPPVQIKFSPFHAPSHCAVL